MTLRFSDRGPAFPPKFVDAMMAGEVVFLCGTGISAPQLPDFKTLVDQTYARLGVEKSESEIRAYENGRFEEVLGSLSRALADPAAMVRAASDLLATPAAPRLDQHITILRLSRDLNNRILTVTTNFDTLLERALSRVAPEPPASSVSFAGQALPAPGSPDFSGIIHIHGRLQDKALDLDATPLVVTSADYGDAYMRSGWASRFLFDLARCKTIVLIGYSANDAPVRYFLNVLEADRSRFPDLRQVYAFDGYENDPLEAEASWGTVAVTPLTYCKLNPNNGIADHSPLWEDLSRLADLIDRPKQSLAQRARAILSRDDATVGDRELDELRWLFVRRGDLWPTAVECISHPRWFNIFQNHKFWTVEEASRLIPAWIARQFEDGERFKVAADWAATFGQPFLESLGRFFRQSPPQAPFWRKAWRLLLTIHPVRPDDFGAQAFSLHQSLRSELVLDDDLRKSVALLVPSFRIRQHFHPSKDTGELREFAGGDLNPRRLSDIVWTDFTVCDVYWANEILDALDDLRNHAPRILELATEALRSFLATAVEFGVIEGDYDANDFDVPSIEDHPQNQHHDGIIFLVRALTNAFGRSSGQNRQLVRGITANWLALPGMIGVRLALQAMRDEVAFSADEALEALLELSDARFWNVRREVALLLRDRTAAADGPRRTAVEARIRETSDTYYNHYIVEAGQVDWRPHARDTAVWLRLTMLATAGALSEDGAKELAAIKARREYLDRAVEDQDFFGSYSTGIHSVVGDSAPIEEADPDDRLRVAIELSHSRDIDRQLGWSSYCRSDPKGAFETLVAAALTEPNLALWNDLLNALAFGDEKDKVLREELIAGSFARLEELEVVPLKILGASVIDALTTGPRRRINNLEEWCDRLWQSVVTDDREIDLEKDLYSVAINSSAGRLAQVQLREIDHCRNTGSRNLARQLERLVLMAAHPGPPGILTRAICVRSLAFLLAADAPRVVDVVAQSVAADNAEGRAQRQILLVFGSVTPEVSKRIPQAIIQAVTESQPDQNKGAVIASQILRPALASIKADNPERWGITEADVAQALRRAALNVRRGALSVLVRWLHEDEIGGERAWRNIVGPFFDRIWPKERRFVDEASNTYIIGLVVGAKEAFADALKILSPYLSPYSRERANLHAIKSSTVPEKFPVPLLELLWKLFGPNGATSYDMAEVLDRLVAANPIIEVDRRFQSLEQRTVRYT
ncbi:SIR2 family protein [Labrys neptuniae]